MTEQVTYPFGSPKTVQGMAFLLLFMARAIARARPLEAMECAMALEKVLPLYVKDNGLSKEDERRLTGLVGDVIDAIMAEAR